MHYRADNPQCRKAVPYHLFVSLLINVRHRGIFLCF